MRRFLMLYCAALGVSAQTVRLVTVKPSGGDYTSLSQAITSEGAIGKDLTAASRNIRLDIECYAFQDTGGQVSIAYWTTDATHYIRIYTPATERHNGTAGTGYQLRIPAYGSGIQITSTRYVTIDGLSLYAQSYDSQHGIYTSVFNTTADIRITNNLLKGGGQPGYRGIGANDPEAGHIANNIILGFGGGGIYLPTSNNGTNYVYNNTLIGGQNTIIGSSTVILKNTIVQGGTTGYSGTFNAASTNNIGAATDSPPGSNPHTGAVAFVNAAAGNYILAATDTVAKGAGANLYADPNLPVTTDILGAARPGSGAFDAGATQNPVAAAPMVTRRRIL
jgi:hypothetical protein